MRQQSCLALSLLIALLSASRGLSQPTLQKANEAADVAPPVDSQAAESKECGAHYLGKYDDNRCLIILDRANPASPLPITVRKGVTVVIRVKDTRSLESIAFDEKTSRIEKPDAFSTFAQSALDPLKSLVLKLVKGPGSLQAMESILVEEDDPLYERQKDIQIKIDQLHLQVLNAAKELTCLTAYQEIDITGTVYSCKRKVSLTPQTFETAKKKAVCDIQGGRDCEVSALKAGVSSLPVARSQAVAGQIAKQIGDLSKGAKDIPQAERDKDDILLSNQARLDAQIKDLQDSQKTLLQAALILSTIPPPTDVEIERKQDKDSLATITVSATDAIAKTTTTLGTVLITWQTMPWRVSTGILFSALNNNAFTNAPIIANGKPVLDSGGKVTTVVAETTTRPTVVFPVVLANYRFAQKLKCERFCAAYWGGGVGMSAGAKIDHVAPRERGFVAV